MSSLSLKAIRLPTTSKRLKSFPQTPSLMSPYAKPSLRGLLMLSGSIRWPALKAPRRGVTTQPHLLCNILLGPASIPLISSLIKTPLIKSMDCSSTPLSGSISCALILLQSPSLNALPLCLNSPPLTSQPIHASASSDGTLLFNASPHKQVSSEKLVLLSTHLINLLVSSPSDVKSGINNLSHISPSLSVPLPRSDSAPCKVAFYPQTKTTYR
ncbi:hypothetical protein PYK22_01416 [Pyrinomonas methylaliphatogenes]|uniref:Uncharacterized protein n=1 Tax=Pyrinomonas methylaliphatogenes TaxID=454194 RepID=A0A0B6WXF4_9BACT|nr:hypothetical protein PYK22_01416 [Pyrinomonas methylaliphatogenes]